MNSRIQSYLQVAASHQRDIERIGSFLATFTPDNNNPFLNYSIPDDYATPSRAGVTALVNILMVVPTLKSNIFKLKRVPNNNGWVFGIKKILLCRLILGTPDPVKALYQNLAQYS